MNATRECPTHGTYPDGPGFCCPRLVEYVQVRCSGCGVTIPDPVPMSLAASAAPILCDSCELR